MWYSILMTPPLLSPSTPGPVFDALEVGGFEHVHLAADPEVGLRLVVAIHSTTLGPAAGGLRMWPYTNEQEAITDALRLARGMTYKYAAAGVDLGGGKAVLIADPRSDVQREELMRAVGRVVDALGGRFRIGEDVGTTLQDMEHIHAETDFVNTLPEDVGGVGDISFATARGTLQALRACAERAWGSPDLSGRTVAVQGLGMVGLKAATMLAEEGAKLVVCDLDAERVERAVDELGATAVDPDEIHRADVDVYAPFALGAVVNDTTLPEIRARVVVGSANNILAEDRHAEALEARGIVYGVDFIANAGGAIYDADRLKKGGFVPRRALAHVDRIGERMRETFAIADAEGITPLAAAYQLAERRLTTFRHLRSR
jgi:leucine dehydrogenase